MDSTSNDASPHEITKRRSTDQFRELVDSSFPAGLETPRAKLVYLYLSYVHVAGVEDLSAALDIDFLTLFPVLDTLIERGLVEDNGAGYRCTPRIDHRPAR